ncbi:MAG: hypothetical protein OEV55_08640 [candidate division Zixibacteria bacterium]|nr:hypothetical protein [candidate division Zixibacteria bacterium]
MLKKTGIYILSGIIFSLLFASFSKAGSVEIKRAEQPVPVSIVFVYQSIPNLNQKVFYQDNRDIPQWGDEFQKPSGRKSITKAMLLSLVLPGAGEFYAENKNRFRFFLGIESAVWSGFAGFRAYGSWKKNDYKGFATSHAGINLDGKSDKFFENMTYYDNRDEYNQFARLYHGDEAVIYPENDFWNWEWDSQDSKARFRELRNQSKSAYRKALFMVGLAALNRVVSMLDAARSVKKFNRQLSSEFSSINKTGLKISLDANFFGRNPHLVLNFNRNF